MTVQNIQVILEKLKQHDYANVQEKIDFLDVLKETKGDLHQNIAWMLISEDKNYRDFSYAIFSKSDKEKNILSILIKEMHGQKEDSIDKIAMVIANLAPKGLDVFIELKINNGSKEDKLLVLKILRRTGTIEGYLPFYSLALKDRDENVRYSVVDILCRAIQKEEIFLLLCPLLMDNNEKICERIINQLVKNKHLKVVPLIFEIMSQQTRENQERLINIVKDLSERMNVDIEKLITPALMNSKKEVRDAGARFFISLPDIHKAMLRLFVHTRTLSMQMRAIVFKAFSFVKKEIADVIINILNDDDPKDCVDAMMISRHIDDSRVIAGVGKILEQNIDWWIKLLGIEILTKYPTPETIRILEMHEDDYFLEWAVVTAYGELKSVDKISFLKKHLSHKSADIRRTALKAIYGMDTPESIEILKSIATEECDWYLHNELLLINEDKELSFAIPDLKKDNNNEVFREHLEKMGIQMQEDHLSENENVQEIGLQDFGIQGVGESFEEKYLQIEESQVGLQPIKLQAINKKMKETNTFDSYEGQDKKNAFQENENFAKPINEQINIPNSKNVNLTPEENVSNFENVDFGFIGNVKNTQNVDFTLEENVHKIENVDLVSKENVQNAQGVDFSLEENVGNTQNVDLAEKNLQQAGMASNIQFDDNQPTKNSEEKTKEEMLTNFRSRFHRSTKRVVAPDISSPPSKEKTKRTHIPDIFSKKKDNKKFPFQLRGGKTQLDQDE